MVKTFLGSTGMNDLFKMVYQFVLAPSLRISLIFFFQCTEHTSSLLLERGFSLPAVKVLLSGGHSEHYSKATAQLAAQEEVILVTMVGSVKLPIKDRKFCPVTFPMIHRKFFSVKLSIKHQKFWLSKTSNDTLFTSQRCFIRFHCTASKFMISSTKELEMVTKINLRSTFPDVKVCPCNEFILISGAVGCLGRGFVLQSI